MVRKLHVSTIRILPDDELTLEDTFKGNSLITAESHEVVFLLSDMSACVIMLISIKVPSGQFSIMKIGSDFDR